MNEVARREVESDPPKLEVKNLFDPEKRIGTPLLDYCHQNVFGVIGQWKMHAKQNGWPQEDIDAVQNAAFNTPFPGSIGVLAVHSTWEGEDFDADDERLIEQPDDDPFGEDEEYE